MLICSNCIHYYKQVVELPSLEVDNTMQSWIDFAGTVEENPTETSYEFAPCVNELTTEEIVERSELTAWFFNNSQYTNTFLNTLIVSELDICPNFEAKP